MSDAGQSRGANSRTAGKRNSLVAFVREIVLVVVLAVVVSTVLRMFVFQMFEIPSSSMENTLQIKDRVTVLKFAEPHRGDIVVFKDSLGWLDDPLPVRGPTREALEFVGILPDSSQRYLIKRVIGMPGDTVACCDAQSRLTVNGVALDESSYLVDGDASRVAFKVVVPAGRVFVMGDNRNNSRDSRCHLGTKGINAFARQQDIQGPAAAIVLPFNRIRTFTTPKTFATVPAPTNPAPRQPVIEPANVSC